MAAAVEGRFVVEKSSVRVLAPEHIRGHHDAAIGNFGVPDYGGTLTGAVLYPPDKKEANGCAPFASKFTAKSRRPVVLLLDRGGNQFLIPLTYAIINIPPFSSQSSSINRPTDSWSSLL